ncbi:MAG: heme biosynthesis protein HemY [Alphaproteobacteria bacterium]
MLKAIWFLLRLALFIGSALWIAEQPGSVQIEWQAYTITVQMGVFLGALLLAVVIAVFIYQVLRAFVTFPASYRYYRSVKDKDKGYRALTAGLTAVAAGDTRAALRAAGKAKRLLPEGQGLPLLLEAQAARLDGREEDAKQSFVALLEDKDASFLGLRGLMQASMEREDYAEALRLAQLALALHPKQSWILKIVYDLHIRLREWGDAEGFLARLVRGGALSKDEARGERVAINLAVALEAVDEGLDDVARAKFAQARRVDRANVPAVLLEVEYWTARGERRKARGLIERFWKREQHPAVVAAWCDLISVAADKDALSRLQWMERLIKVSGESGAVQLAAGRFACAAGLWGEARSHLMKALDLEASAAVYQALAVLEEREKDDRDAARAWREKAIAAPAAAAWVCRESGLSYERWSPIAAPHGSFNTIEWAVPSAAAGLNILRISDDDSLLDTPRLQP